MYERWNPKTVTELLREAGDKAFKEWRNPRIGKAGAAQGAAQGASRFPVFTEHIDDIIADLDQALKAAGG